jgi:hypothetical protein
MFFTPCIVIQLYNTNKRNVQFYKLTFNFCCLLQVSNLVGSSSGRQLYMQYGMLYSLVDGTVCSRLNTLEHTLLSTKLLTPMHVQHTTLHTQLSP